MLPPRPPRYLLAGLALALAACHPAEKAARAPAAAEAPAVDAGAPVLAAVQNARAAITVGDPVAAYNDVNLGISYAVQLVGADSALYPAEAAPPGYQAPSGGGQGAGGGGGGGSGRHGHGGGHHQAAAGGQPAQPSGPPAIVASAPPASPSASTHGHHADGHRGGAGATTHNDAAAPAPVSSFDVQVRLISAETKLQARDAAGADADLQAVEAAAARVAAPVSLPLIRAGQSLSLAATAVSGGRLPQLSTQLAAAQAALEAYRGAPHAAEARAVAAAIGHALRQPGGAGALPAAQIALWSGVVGAWS